MKETTKNSLLYHIHERLKNIAKERKMARTQTNLHGKHIAEIAFETMTSNLDREEATLKELENIVLRNDGGSECQS